MSCRERVSTASAYVDRELSAEEMDRFAAHLEGCADCAARVSQFAAIAERTAQLPRAVQPTPALRARLEALAGADRSRRWGTSRIGRFGLVAIAASSVVLLLAVVTMPWWRNGARDAAESLVEDHLRSVPEALPAEVASDDPAAIIDFFAPRVPFEAAAPRLPGSRILGGRLCRVNGGLTQLIFYHHAHRTLSLYVAGHSLGVEGCRTANGHEVCTRRHGDTTLTLVGALPRSEVRRLLDEARL